MSLRFRVKPFSTRRDSTVKEVLRVIRSKEAARQAYNRLSGWYDGFAGSSELKFNRIGLQGLGVKAGETVLEIGYGTGHCILELADAVGPVGKVLGIDISDRMREIAMFRIRKAGLLARVKLECADALCMPYANGSVDAILICFTLELFDTPELEPLLVECKRVLKEKGRICIVAMSREGKRGLSSRVYDWAHGIVPNYIDCRPIYVEELLMKAGFRTTDKRLDRMWGLPIEIVLSLKR